MATIGQNSLTLVDAAKRIDPDGKTARIAEVLTRQHGLDYMLWQEGNLETGNRTSARQKLPSVGTRRLNAGVAKTKSVAIQSDDAAALYEGHSKVDEDVLAIAPDMAAARFNEDLAYIEAFNQQIASDLWYGNSAVDETKFNGLATRLNSTSVFSGTVLSAAGSSDLTSVYLVGWGDNGVYGFYPKNSQAGLQTFDAGKQLVQDDDGNDFFAYVTQFKWKCGLTIKNWRQVARLANIDTGDLEADASSGTNLINGMVQLTNAVQNLNTVKPVIYVNRTILTYLDLQLLNKANVQLSYMEAEGKTGRVLTFRGIPVVMNEMITNTETAIS